MFLYRLYDDQDTLLYVGITGDDTPHRRARSHVSTHSWGRDIARYESDEIPDAETRLIERQVIRALRPLHNVEHAVGYTRSNLRAKQWVERTALESIHRLVRPNRLTLTEAWPNTRYGIAHNNRFGRPSRLAHRPAKVYVAWHAGQVINVGGRMECGGIRPSLKLTNSTEGMGICQRCVDAETERLREEEELS